MSFLFLPSLSSGGGGSGTVTSVSVVTANGVSGSVANPTTTPAITLTLGAITPSSVAAVGTVTGSNLSGTNTGDVTIGTANGLSIVGQVLSLALSSTSTTGALSDTDWDTFNNKQPAGNYITALTTDVVASGPGSVVATIQSNVVSNSKLAQAPTLTIKGNNTGGTANVLDLTVAQVQTMLGTSGTNTGDVTLSAFGSSPNANAATLTGQALTLQPASASFPGGVTTGTQSFAGNKTFTGTIAASNFSGTSSGTNTGDQLIFQTIACPAGTNPVADTTSDTLTLAASTGLTITGNSGTDTITWALNLGAIDHNSLLNLTTGDPHTQYTKDPGTVVDKEITIWSGTGGRDFATSSGIMIDALEIMPTASNTNLILDGNGTGFVQLNTGANSQQFPKSRPGSIGSPYLTINYLTGQMAWDSLATILYTWQAAYDNSAAGGEFFTVNDTDKGLRIVDAVTPITGVMFAVRDNSETTEYFYVDSEKIYTEGHGEFGNPGSETSGVNIGGTTYQLGLRVNDIGGGRQGQMMMHRHSTSFGSKIIGSRANSDTSAHSDVTASMELLAIEGCGWAGSNYKIFAQVELGTDASGTISNTSAPGAIRFFTTPDGSTTPTIGMTLNRQQNLTVVGTIGGSNLSGANTGDQTITLTGDVTGSGTGSFAATIANNAVTNAKLADMATLTIKGNNTGGSSDPLDLTVAQVNTMLATVVGPGSATDDAIVTFDGTTGKLVQNSLGILSSAGALSGLTQLDVDNLRLDGNTLSSTDTNGNILVAPNGTGGVRLGASATDYWNVSSAGVMQPQGAAVYRIASNTYAFSAASSTSAGLKFSTSPNRFNFTDTSGNDIIFFPLISATHSTFGYSAPSGSPAQITSNQNNYAGSGQTAIWRLDTDAARDLTGIAAPSSSRGKFLRLFYVGANSVTLKYDNASSSAANRILCTTGADIVLNPNEGATLWYDDVTLKWRATKLA